MRSENPEANRLFKELKEKFKVTTKPSRKEPNELNEAVNNEVDFIKGSLFKLLWKKKSIMAFPSFNYSRYKQLEEENISMIYSKHFFDECEKHQQSVNNLCLKYKSRKSFICLSTRQATVDALIELSKEKSLSNSTVFLSVHLFDLYLIEHNESNENNESVDFRSWYFKLCFTCLLIASKNEDRHPISTRKIYEFLKAQSISIDGR